MINMDEEDMVLIDTYKKVPIYYDKKESQFSCTLSKELFKTSSIWQMKEHIDNWKVEDIDRPGFKTSTWSMEPVQVLYKLKSGSYRIRTGRGNLEEEDKNDIYLATPNNQKIYEQYLKLKAEQTRIYHEIDKQLDNLER